METLTLRESFRIKRLLANPKVRWDNVHWGNVIVFGVVHLFAALGVMYWAIEGLHWRTKTFLFVYWYITAFSVTGGMHRGFTHRSYKCGPRFEKVMVYLAAATFQGPLTHWVVWHLEHHSHDSTEKDPHNIKWGFIWAHIGWVIWCKDRVVNYGLIPKLMAKPWVRFQEEYYFPLAAAMGLGLPLVVCALWGDGLGGLLVAGFGRICFQYHATWLINSAAHIGSNRPLSKLTTAVNRFFIAIVSVGEGWHNNHHGHSRDYANGFRWWEIDFTKYTLWSLSKVRIIGELHVSDRTPIEAH